MKLYTSIVFYKYMGINTNTNGNIELTISDNFKNKGLSHVIDAALEEELNAQNQINMSAAEWNSIFAKIKAEQVETNQNQFNDKDNDVSNFSHFKVSQGATYEIKQSTWSYILDVAKAHLAKNKAQQGITGTQSASAEPVIDASASVNTKKEIKTETPESLVKAYLSKAGFNVDSLEPLFIKEVVSKYNLIKKIKPDIKEDELEQRTVNFAKGLQFHEFGSKNKTGEYEVESPEETGEALVELYDQNGDGVASLDELFYRKLIDEYSKKGGSYQEMKQKAMTKVKEFSQYINNPAGASEETKLSDEWNWFSDCLSQMGLLDVIDNEGKANNDNLLNKKELGAFVDAQMNRNNAVPAATRRLADKYIQSHAMDIDDIMELYHLSSREKAEKFISNRDIFLANLQGFQNLI